MDGQEKKAQSPIAEQVQPYVEGVAKSLVDRIYGPDGLLWGTKLTEFDDVVIAIRGGVFGKHAGPAAGEASSHVGAAAGAVSLLLRLRWSGGGQAGPGAAQRAHACRRGGVGRAGDVMPQVSAGGRLLFP